jgi:hypothetical protein
VEKQIRLCIITSLMIVGLAPGAYSSGWMWPNGIKMLNMFHTKNTSYKIKTLINAFGEF